MEKRTKNITLHLTQTELELLETVAEHHQRKPAELARLLLTWSTRKEWAKIQEHEHPNEQPFHSVSLD